MTATTNAATSPSTNSATASDTRIAVVLMAYGTPRSRDEVLPYYTDIRRGRAPTEQQLADLIARYEAIATGTGTDDILSPLTLRTEAQRDALQAALDEQAPDRYVVVLGMKHASPMIEEAVQQVASMGIGHIVGLVLAPHYSSYSIGQYMDRVAAAAQPHGITVTRVQSWATEPAFVQFLADDLAARLAAMPAETKVLFTAHSLPQRIIDAGDPYPDELRSTAAAVAERVGLREWSQWAIAWQSAGRTPEPWLGPDILQVIDELAASEHHVPQTPDGPQTDHADHADSDSDSSMGIVVCACGFVADHLEVLYDLDIEAANRASDHGLAFDRTSCVNDDRSVMAALATKVISAS